MKVNDIRSFFKAGASKSKNTAEEAVVEVPSRLKKGSTKKSKKDDDRLNISIERSGDDSDQEDPLPRSSRKDDRNGRGRSRKPVIDDDSDDNEDPLPKSARKKEDRKDRSADKKRKARVLSESDDDEDFKKKTEKPAAKQAKVEKPEKKKEEVKLVDPADFFGSAPVRREKKETQKEVEKTPAKAKTPEKKNTSERKKSPPRAEHKTPEKKVASERKKSPVKAEPKTPERKTKSKTEEQKLPEKSKKSSPDKKDPNFKVPTPVNTEKSKPRTSRPVKKEENDDDEDNFDPKEKASAKKSSKPAKSRDTTPAPKEDEEVEAPKVTTPRNQNYMKYLAKMSMKPKNLGSKEIPIGAPKCLEGKTFVISGVLDSLERDDCKELVEKYGGRVTSAVSGKTSYLILGDDPGESKVKKAVQLKVPQIHEDDLLEMIRKSNPDGNSQDSGFKTHSEEMSVDDDDYDPDKSLFSTPSNSQPTKSPRRSGRSPSKLAAKDAETPTRTKQEDKKHSRSPSKSAKEESPSKKIKVEDQKKPKVEIKQEPKASATAPSQPATPLPPDAGLMWVDKYKPKNLKNVVGQTSEASNARKLVRWLQNWFNYHGTSQDKPKAAWPGLKDPEGKTFKAALLSGPPGIGKTTSAHLAVREVGYDYFELNASDTRNKRGLHENVADALSSKSLVFSRGNEELTKKHVLIMDEVDGMSGNEDRGGVQELIALIKSSRVPIICICNDRNHQKIRSLANYCFDLRFNKPSFEQLKAFVMSICFKEKMKVPQDKIQQLIISTDNDVRQILHQLELFKEGKTDQAYAPKKDLRFGPWDVIRKVFLKSEHDKMSIHDKNGLFFQDYSIGPLFVQENYLKWAPAKAGGNRNKTLTLVSKTAGSLADGDMVESVIRRLQNWSLLPVQGVFQSYIPGELMESNQMGGVEFPQWLGKNSNRSKRHRLLQSLHTHLHLHVSGSLEALNKDYLPYLRRAITKPLVAGDAMEAAKVMEDYTLLREDVESISDLSIWPGTKDPMERVETKVKTAFTKQVNKEILPYSNAKPVKAKGRGGGTQEDDLDGLLEDGEGEAENDEEEEESIEKDAMVKVRTRKTGAAKASSSKTTTSSKASSSTNKGKGRGKK